MHTAKEAILGKLRATGPCTLAELAEEVRMQATDGTVPEDYIVAELVTTLIREGVARIYDTGDCFDAAAPEFEQLAVVHVGGAWILVARTGPTGARDARGFPEMRACVTVPHGDYRVMENADHVVLIGKRGGCYTLTSGMYECAKDDHRILILGRDT